MKCTKCGNELKNGVKFCPQCGEAIKEEKKMRYCTKCGAEIQPYASFCAKCGTNVNVVQEQGAKKTKKQSGKYKKMFLIAGIAIIVLLSIGGIMLNSDKAMYKAYVKFHEEYCEKNLDYEEYNDCAARIVMAPNNEKWLAIWDITNLRYDGDGRIVTDSVKDKITLYSYGWGRVKKIVTFSKESVYNSYSAYFSLIDDKLYFTLDGHIDENDNLKGVYCLNDHNTFEVVRIKKEEKGDDIKYKTDSGMDWYDLGILCNYIYTSNFIPEITSVKYNYYSSDIYDRYNRQLQIMNDMRVTNVSDFARVVDELSKHKIKNQSDLQIAYGKIIRDFIFTDFAFAGDKDKEELLSGYPVVGTMKTKYGFYLVRTSGNAALMKVSDKEDISKALESADGRKVTRIECVYGADVPENLKIPEGITYISGFWGQKKLKSIKLPDSLKEIGDYGFENCLGLEEIEIPDSVEKIGMYAFDSAGLSPVIITSEASYAQQYAEKNDLDWSEKKMNKAELDKKRKLGEVLTAYQTFVDEWDYDNYYRGVTLEYTNGDIPECFVWTDWDEEERIGLAGVLSYEDGEVIVQNKYEEGYIEYEMTDDRKNYVIMHRNYENYEEIEEYISSLGLKDSFSVNNVASSVSNAYKSID